MTGQKDLPSSTSAFGQHAQGAPDAPEESNPRGHDSFNPPETAPPAGQVPHSALPAAPETNGKPPGSGAVTDAEFLADEFGIGEHRAASLVATGREQGETAEKLAWKVQQARRNDDPLAGLPTPQEPANDLASDTDEEPLKPVLHVKNNRVGGG